MNINYQEKAFNNNWNDIFDNEEDLLHGMMQINASPKQPIYKIPKGYVYLSSFQQQVKNGNKLSEKQMQMLKRLAISIFKAGKAQKVW